ncbi:MAG: hypothetical protein V3V05_04565 [Pontiella sp.]
MNVDLSKYIVPALGAACVGGALLVVSGLRTPVRIERTDHADAMEARLAKSLVLNECVPTMDEVVAKHLFVPERVATGENAFPDLLVKGVYMGEIECNVVFSLKSKPDANLRVWQGDQEASISQVEDRRDPRRPIADFLSEWQIKSIGFSGVTVQHIITGEVETYVVDYKPAKHVKDSSQAGYGQGMLSAAPPAGNKVSTKASGATTKSGGTRTPAAGSTGAIAGRVGQYMQNLSPQQRQQFMQQLQQQRSNAAKNRDGGGNTA